MAQTHDHPTPQHSGDAIVMRRVRPFGPGGEEGIVLTTPSQDPDGHLDDRHSAYHDNRSPPLVWTPVENAAAYARERRQGRALTGAAEPGEKADSILVHPDVRRMLMDGRAFNEGARALALWGALQVDLAHKAATEEERQAADDLISLLTPVIKGYLTDKGYETATKAQQVFGGHGYIREWGMEQFVRDARIAMIYEGANGVQAMDLVGRKLAQNGGRAVQARRLTGSAGDVVREQGWPWRPGQSCERPPVAAAAIA